MVDSTFKTGVLSNFTAKYGTYAVHIKEGSLAEKCCDLCRQTVEVYSAKPLKPVEVKKSLLKICKMCVVELGNPQDNGRYFIA